MSKRSFIKGVVVGVASVIGLLALLIFAMPQLYLASENSNFAKMREKSELNCKTMPLHCLVRDNDVDGIDKYAKDGMALELKDGWGMTALHWAMTKDKPVLVGRLLSLGANPDAKDENNRSIIYQAVAWGRFDMATKLLSHGADIDGFNGDRFPESALHYCVMKDKPECVRYLIEHGANTYLKDSYGYTVYERVQMHPHISEEVSRLLIK